MAKPVMQMPAQVQAIADSIMAQAPTNTQMHVDAAEIVRENKNYKNAKNITQMPERDIMMMGGKVERVKGSLRVDY
jgi:hypothetical protein